MRLQPHITKAIRAALEAPAPIGPVPGWARVARLLARTFGRRRQGGGGA